VGCSRSRRGMWLKQQAVGMHVAAGNNNDWLLVVASMESSSRDCPRRRMRGSGHISASSSAAALQSSRYLSTWLPYMYEHDWDAVSQGLWVRAISTPWRSSNAHDTLDHGSSLLDGCLVRSHFDG
jgi:hypothetical protein